jgi:hypothetical protein
VAVSRPHRRTVRTDRARAEFLRVFSETCNVSEAARAAGIGRRSAYDWREADAEFAADWDEAEAVAVDKLEHVAWQRATDGESDRMLEILLKAHRPDKYVERSKVDMNVSGIAEELEAARKRATGE